MSKVIVIGGGIIGLSSAYYLVKSGYQVTVIDKGDFSDNCSYGNAGMIVPSHFVPLATPGMISKGIRWMLNSKSPFYVKPSLNLELIDWGLKFMKASTQTHVEASAVPLRDISVLSKQLLADLAAEPDFDFGLTQKGILAFFKSDKVGEEEAELCEKGRNLGLDMEMLDAEACSKLQPDLKLDVLGAAHYKCDAHIDPNKLMTDLLNFLKLKGVEIVANKEVTGFEKRDTSITGVHAGGQFFEADTFVLATGSWSPAIAKLAGESISLMPGKGYSFNLPKIPSISIPALLCEARVAITPMGERVRIGGTMELDKINSRINMQRLSGIVESIPKYFPELDVQLPEQKSVWFGFRPASPDGLPYIGRSGKRGNLIIATGHGMMGLSLGQATGKLVEELISEKTLSIFIHAFSPNRYS